MRKQAALFLLYIAMLTSSALISSAAGEKKSTGKVTYHDVLDNNGFQNRLTDNLMVDSIVVHKAAHEMSVFRNQVMLKKYQIHLGVNPIGPKEFSGDLKTPEGLYFISFKNPASKFHKSLGISYPNSTDLQRAAKAGKSAGGEIMIHGLPNGEENVGPDRYINDWTWGCVAVRNLEIEELFDHVEVGTPLLITP